MTGAKGPQQHPPLAGGDPRWQPRDRVGTMMSILLMRTLGLKKVKSCAEGHIAGKGVPSVRKDLSDRGRRHRRRQASTPSGSGRGGSCLKTAQGSGGFEEGA